MAKKGEITGVDALAQLAFLVVGVIERRAAEHDLSLVQTRLLGVLRDREPTMNELGALLGLDKSSTSGLVDRAQRRGLVTRVPSETDRRSVRVRLTDVGRAFVTRAAATIGTDLTAMLDRLPKAERSALRRTAGRFVVAQAKAAEIDLTASVPTTAGDDPVAAPGR